MGVTRRRSVPQRQRKAASEGRFNERPGGRLALTLCGGLLLTVLIMTAAVGVMYVRLLHGPVSLKFLGDAIERGINAEMPGYQAQLDDALVALSEAGTLELRLTNLKLFEGDGDAIATVPTAAVELSRPALWSFKLVPSRIDLIDAQLSLTYSNEGGLTIDLAREGTPAAPIARVKPAPAQNAPGGGAATAEGGGINLAGIVTEAMTQVRKRLDAASYLTQIGVRDGVVTLDNQGTRNSWRVTDGVIEIDRAGGQSVVTGAATIASDRGPWSVTLHSELAGAGQGQTLSAAIQNLVPRTLGLVVPQLSLLETINAPVNADARIEVAPGGQVRGGTLAIAIGRGQFELPEVDVPFVFDGGHIDLAYDEAGRRIDLKPSTFTWGDSRVQLTGAAVADRTQRSLWALELATAGGQLTAEEFGVPPAAIEHGVLKARVAPAAGEVFVDQLSFRAGGTEFKCEGQFLTGIAPGSGGAKFDATVGTTQADTLKALWPRLLAPGARKWVGERIRRGTIKNGSLKFVSGRFASDSGIQATGSSARRLTVAMEAADLQATPLKWLGPLEAPRALLRLEDHTFEVSIPEASVVQGANKRIALKTGRFFIPHLETDPPDAEITFKIAGALVPVLDALDQSPLHVLRNNGVTTDGIDGKIDGQIKLTLPLYQDVDAKSVKIEAKAKVLDGRMKQAGGVADLQGAVINLDVTDAAINATGDLLANGVPVKLGWQRILEDNGEKQPPLRLSANLDNADRVQLGIDINHIVQGEVPVEILIEKGAAEENSVRLRADLTNAEIGLESINWRKAPGRPASLGADIVKGKTNKIELQNFHVTGEDLSIDGSLGIGADNRLREVHFPNVALNVVSRFDVQANLKTDAGDKTGVWQVKIKGQTFDGRDFFRSLLSVGGTPERAAAKPGKAPPGLDVEAEIDNVIGHSEVSIRNLKLKSARRGDKLSLLDARGTLDGGAAIAVSMAPEAGQGRRLLADTLDAGQAFKLMGFYPNMQGGRGRLEVNLDGRGAAEKTGVVWVDNFRILGDPVVSEVLGSTPDTMEAGKPVRRGKPMQREVLDFNQMKIPFSVGYGQFVIDNAYLRGPLLGVNLVGKADFKMQSVSLGGTYIPLQGLNNAFGGVPILGALVSGPKGDGVFGITFAVQGPMSQPQVLVNPLSLVAPGAFRELFQMTNQNPKVVPREDKAPSQPVEKRVRSSSSPTDAPAKGAKNSGAKGNTDGKGRSDDTVDGWDSRTAPAKRQ